MPRFKHVPDFVRMPSGEKATPSEVNEAALILDKLRGDPAWEAQVGFRRAALAARLNSGAALTPLLYCEFAAQIPTDYKLAAPNLAAAAEGAKIRSDAAAARDAARSRERSIPPDEQLAFAQATMSTQAYAEFCKRNPGLVARGLERR